MVSKASTSTELLRAKCLLMLLLLAADSKERRRVVCGITFIMTFNTERKQQTDVVPIRTRKNHAASRTHPHQKAIFFSGSSLYGPPSWTHTKDDTSDMAVVQPTEHPRTAGIEGVRTHASISLLRTSTGVGCLASDRDWRSRSLKIYVGKDEEDRTGLGRQLFY